MWKRRRKVWLCGGGEEESEKDYMQKRHGKKYIFPIKAQNE